MIPKKVREILEKQHYAIVGEHSAVQICKWTKSSLNGKDGCWKEKFYGIKSHRCCQFSPAVMWCENQCLHCWRPIEMNLGMQLKKIDNPKEILDGIIKARKKLLLGFKGNKNTSEKKFEEAMKPTLFTLSLSGEPTLYPQLDEMIKEIKKRKAISFLVTNGQNPEVIKRLMKNNALPTQLTISVNTPNKRLFEIWHRSKKQDSWKRFNESLEIIKSLKGKTRRVIRLTLVKQSNEKGKYENLSNMKDEYIEQYAKLIEKAEPDFIHVKGFKSLGYSRKRFSYSKQPFHEDVKKFAEKLMKKLKKSGYKILAEERRSCVVLLGKDKSKMKICQKEI
ncbi:4-demethylwyosine synthase TYW1 [Candidatus Pacearchaeota archaeon]|nr:MAG: 4-demethylwyosine synthase TYW1 [Candidatus Pacearchaeota archaeon]